MHWRPIRKNSLALITILVIIGKVDFSFAVNCKESASSYFTKKSSDELSILASCMKISDISFSESVCVDETELHIDENTHTSFRNLKNCLITAGGGSVETQKNHLYYL